VETLYFLAEGLETNVVLIVIITQVAIIDEIVSFSSPPAGVLAVLYFDPSLFFSFSFFVGEGSMGSAS
jgi:hypothetical protein